MIKHIVYIDSNYANGNDLQLAYDILGYEGWTGQEPVYALSNDSGFYCCREPFTQEDIDKREQEG